MPPDGRRNDVVHRRRRPDAPRQLQLTPSTVPQEHDRPDLTPSRRVVRPAGHLPAARPTRATLATRTTRATTGHGPMLLGA